MGDVAVLAERDTELDTLRSVIDQASSGNGRAVCITGPAGIGKTSLLNAATELAADRGMTVLVASGSRIEREFPFGVSRQLFDRVLRDCSDTQREVLLTGPGRLGAEALCDTPSAVDTSGVPSDASFGIVHGLFSLVTAASVSTPLVLAIDDAQWGDDASLRFVLYVARRVAELPVLVVLAARTGEQQREPTIGALFDTAGLVTLAPKPLTTDGARRLLESYAGRRLSLEVADRLRFETGGNPFLLRELARARAANEVGDGVQEWQIPPIGRLPAPESVARSILGRLHDLGPDATALVNGIVVLGDGCLVAEAAATAELSAAQAAAAAAGLIRAGILEHADVLRFVHPLVRTAIEGALAPAETAVWHGRAAHVLIRRAAERGRILTQLLNSAPLGDSSVARLLHEAGRDAIRKGGARQAEAFFRRALQEDPGPELAGALLTDLGAALLATDQAAAALPVLRRAREMSQRSRELADRTVLLWLALFASGAIGEGIELIETTIQQLKDDREAVLLLESESVTAALFKPDRLGETRRRLAEHTALAGRTPAERRLMSLQTIVMMHTAESTADAVADRAQHSYANGQLVRENTLDPTKWVWAVGALILLDQIEQAGAALEVARDVAAASGSLASFVAVKELVGWLQLREGRVADAEAELVECLELLDEADASQLKTMLQLAITRWLVVAMSARGRVVDAERLLQQHGLDGELDPSMRHTALYYERGMLRLEQQRHGEALDDARRLAAFHARYSIETVAEAPWRPVAALAFAGLGRASEAVEVADDHLRLARIWGLPRDVGLALRTRARVEPALDTRVALLHEAQEVLRRSPAQLEIAATDADLGAALRQAGRRAEAQRILASALAIATRCGATALVERIRAELRQVAAGPGRGTLTGSESLTPSEWRIAELAAKGMSNREIARELFLSVRTVENTLRRVYQKLAIGSRRDLIRSLG